MGIKSMMGAAAAAMMAATGWGAALPSWEATVCGGGTVRFLCAGRDKPVEISVGIPDRGPHAPGGVQRDRHKYIDYATWVAQKRAGQPEPPFTPYSNCVLSVASKDLGFQQGYFLLPNFHNGWGLYSHEEVVASMPEWRKLYPVYPERAITFRLTPGVRRDETLCYMDDSLVGRVDGRLAVTGAAVSASARLANTPAAMRLVRSAAVPLREADGYYEVPALALPLRSNAALREGAALSIPAGPQTVAGIPMTVWPVARSLDQARVRKHSSRRNLCANPETERTPWIGGPEYLHWRVPGRTWQYAYVLCANLGTNGTRVIGTQLAKFGRGCTYGNLDFSRTELDDATGGTASVPSAADATERVPPWAKVVGTLTYREGGETRTTPLMLVRHALNIGRLGARTQGATALDFEFVGNGQGSAKVPPVTQIFGCTLVEAPFSFAANHPIRGLIFEGDDPRRAHFEVTANRDGVKGSMDYEIYDPLFKTLKKASVPFAVAKYGEKASVDLAFDEWPLGWYGLDVRFKDETGALIATHEAAFTCLAPDTREAGYESPYAAWPHSNGYHGSNTNRFEQLDVMRKAGYRKSWEPPCRSEAEGKPWKVTLSAAGFRYCKPGWPSLKRTEAEFRKTMDDAVAHIRGQFEAYPHCDVIMLLHEQGGREISAEVANGVPGVRGEYRGWSFDPAVTNLADRGEWDVFYCTEFCKRMHREFPGKKIMIGNGSSSCEKVASLVRRGFDLALVDQLGIESKGFGTMPELNSNMESPGMLWALRETGRAFGYTNFTLNACNEYVFRAERRVGRTWSRAGIMRPTDYTLRDFLISHAHGVKTISTGHLEDANDAYYDTNWGAGGQCTFYPYSYPKRMFTALAVLTRVIDCATFLRMVPTGETTGYAMEFRRDRKAKDYAYALWTPQFDATLEMTFPKGARLVHTAPFGVDTPLAADAEGRVTLTIGSTPCYVVADVPVAGCRIVGHPTAKVPADAIAYFTPSVTNMAPCEEYAHDPNPWAVPHPCQGAFDLRMTKDETFGTDVFEYELVRTGAVPRIRWEGKVLRTKGAREVDFAKLRGLGVWVKGNGSFGKIRFGFRKYPIRRDQFSAQLGHRGYITFDGWQFITVDFDEWPYNEQVKGKGRLYLDNILIGDAREALDPIEMRPTRGNVRIGPVFLLPRDGEKLEDFQSIHAADAWKNTHDRDR